MLERVVGNLSIPLIEVMYVVSDSAWFDLSSIYIQCVLVWRWLYKKKMYFLYTFSTFFQPHFLCSSAVDTEHTFSYCATEFSGVMLKYYLLGARTSKITSPALLMQQNVPFNRTLSSLSYISTSHGFIVRR